MIGYTAITEVPTTVTPTITFHQLSSVKTVNGATCAELSRPPMSKTGLQRAQMREQVACLMGIHTLTTPNLVN